MQLDVPSAAVRSRREPRASRFTTRDRSEKISPRAREGRRERALQVRERTRGRPVHEFCGTCSPPARRVCRSTETPSTLRKTHAVVTARRSRRNTETRNRASRSAGNRRSSRSLAFVVAFVIAFVGETSFAIPAGRGGETQNALFPSGAIVARVSTARGPRGASDPKTYGERAARSARTPTGARRSRRRRRR